VWRLSLVFCGVAFLFGVFFWTVSVSIGFLGLTLLYDALIGALIVLFAGSVVVARLWHSAKGGASSPLRSIPQEVVLVFLMPMAFALLRYLPSSDVPIRVDFFLGAQQRQAVVALAAAGSLHPVSNSHWSGGVVDLPAQYRFTSVDGAVAIERNRRVLTILFFAWLAPGTYHTAGFVYRSDDAAPDGDIGEFTLSAGHIPVSAVGRGGQRVTMTKVEASTHFTGVRTDASGALFAPRRARRLHCEQSAWIAPPHRLTCWRSASSLRGRCTRSTS